MTALLADWLFDTFLYTGVLIAAVLLLRRPVSRHFGPQVAYALWALPLLRFAMPPLVLPAWLAPAPDPVPASGASGPLLVLISDAPGAGAGPVMASPPQISIALIDLIVPLWVGGAALFLLWRARSYMAMRREFLAEARPVGEAGNVRLVETPAVSSPLAFGVRDKVVALPARFMAHHDREARDLAIAHELAHHRGHDLLANIAAQPLLALHWFNPLAWAGWRAMRRDQEAACDARVVAGRGRTDRALYASVIAGFAAGDRRPALAAPMACPVLAEKSIIYRLRSLANAEVPMKRRRSGLFAIGAAALGLPLTASISYAHPAPLAVNDPLLPLGVDGPLSPAQPLAPTPIERIDPDVHQGEHAEDGDGERRHRHVIVRRYGPDGMAAHGDEHWPGMAALDRMLENLDHDFGPDFEARMEAHQEELERALEAQQQALEEAGEAREQALEDAAEAREEALEAAAESREEALEAAEEAREHALRHGLAMRAVPQVSTRIRCDGDQPVVERELAGGRRAIIICNNVITLQAVSGLREARRGIERNSDLPEEERQRLLRDLDQQIEHMSAHRISVSLRYETSPEVVRQTVVGPAVSRAVVFAPGVVLRSGAHLNAPIANLRVEKCTTGDIA